MSAAPYGPQECGAITEAELNGKVQTFTCTRDTGHNGGWHEAEHPCGRIMHRWPV